MKIRVIAVMLLGAASSFAAADYGEIRLSKWDVVRMVQKSSIVLGDKGEISIDEIIDKINASPDGFRLMPEDVRQLRRRRVPELIINAMFAQREPVYGATTEPSRNRTAPASSATESRTIANPEGADARPASIAQQSFFDEP